MINCADCSICKSRKMGDYPSIIGFGEADSDVLVIFENSLQELPPAGFPVEEMKELFGANSASEKLAINVYAKNLKVLLDVFGQAFFTTSTRCYFEFEIEQSSEELDYCSIFTRALISERKIIVTTLVGLSQFSSSLIKKAEEFETYKTSDCIVVVIPPLLSIIGDKDSLNKVKDIVSRARSSIGT